VTIPTVMLSPSGAQLSFWSTDQLRSSWDTRASLKVLANGCRLNALSAIQAAGSGHIGTSLSALDIMVTAKKFLAGDTFLSEGHQEDGIFFSSKGHDAPGLYSVMHLCGQLHDTDLLTLRRLGGLPGHPETITPGVPTNTGSLGMGISKAKGFIRAARLDDPDSRRPVIVMLGDGELNEGQIWESMPGATRDGYSELIAIVDANAIQSDTWVEHTLPMGNIGQRVEAVGWHYLECDGQDPEGIMACFVAAVGDPRPTFILAHTTKGSGVSFMESFDSSGEYYKFHSGALAPEVYAVALSEVVPAFSGVEFVVDQPALESSRNEFDASTPRSRPASMLTLWEEQVQQLMAADPDIVIMDGDLSYDTGTHLARKTFPERYVQAGIAEQDMVSMAGTLALAGKKPLVHSFSTFLTMRAAEQIFNNSTEYSRVLYFGFLAGLIPSAPGFSHQAVTDVGLMSSVPRMHLVEPSCASELEQASRWALAQGDPVYFRMGTTEPVAAATDTVAPGELTHRAPGTGVAIVSSGPLLTQQALLARDELVAAGGDVPAIYTMPWICSPLSAAAVTQLSQYAKVVVLENHNPARAKHFLVDAALRDVAGVSVSRMGLEGIPANGQPAEVLAHHHLDAAAMVKHFSL